MCNELLTSNTYALRGVMSQPLLMANPSCIPDWQEQPSVDNPLRHRTSLSEVGNQGVPLYYLQVSLLGKTVKFFSFLKWEVSSVSRPHEVTEVKL